MSNVKENDVPIGFGMALAQNPGAMQNYATRPENEQHKILQQARSVNSKEAMSALVDSISKNQFR